MRRFIAKLNKAVLPLAVAVALVLCFVSPVTASADWDDPVDYTNMPYSVELGSDFNYVYFSWYGSNCMWTICKSSEPNKMLARSLNSGSIDFTFEAGVSYIIRCYPFGTNGLLLDHIPNGTDIGIAASFDVDAGSSSTDFDAIPSADVYGWFKNRNEKSSSREEFGSFPLASLSDPFSVVLPIDSEVLFSKVAADEGVVYDRFIPMIALNGFVASNASNKDVHISLRPSSLVMKMPSSYWVQFQNDVLDSKLEMAIEDFQEFKSNTGSALEAIQDKLTLQGNNFHNFTVFVFDEFDRVREDISASTASVNNNIDLSKVEILNAISALNDSIVAGTPEMDSIAQNSNQNLSNSSNKLDSLGDQLAAVDKPNVEDIKPSAPADIVTDPNAGVLLSAPITSMWQNKVIFGIISTVLTLVLLSWVFFGKK